MVCRSLPPYLSSSIPYILQGILHGANVIMPDITPQEERGKYMIYDGKKITDEEAGENLERIAESMRSIGYELSMERGDYIP